MSEQSSQEPTMEEILASIRRIISEDDAPADAAQPVAAAAPEPAPAPVEIAPPAPEPEDDDTLELTQKVDTLGDLEVYTPPVAAPAPPPAPEPVAAAAPPPKPAPAPQPSVDAGLVGERAASAAASAFGQLSAAIAMPAEAKNLEDIVREMMRPMLQQWLDTNLPGIVQQAVEGEVERIARSRTR
jgi:cell pole-organizing protein PopZ